MPPSTLNLKPLNFLSVMKLTTPPTASEPYEADAPPVTTSTRFTSSCGNWLTSVTPVTFAPTTRWPSSRVRVRMVPRPRRLSELKPWMRSEEHTSELQSRRDLVCRLLLEKKKEDNA